MRVHGAVRGVEFLGPAQNAQPIRHLAPLAEFCRAPRFDESKETYGVRMYAPERPATILDRIKRKIGGRI